MASKDVHKRHIKEHFQEIDDAIAIGMEERPTTIGFHTSACSIDLLELYLHSAGKISTGTMIKHEWFKTPTIGQKTEPLAERKVEVTFEDKEEIFKLMYIIEEERNKLIYGKPTKNSLEKVLSAFNTLKKILLDKINKTGEEIE